LLLELIPGLLESGVPGHKGLVVMRTEVVQIFNDEDALNSFGNLPDAWQHAVGKDIGCDPGIIIGLRYVVSNGMEQKNALIAHGLGNDVHKGSIVLCTDMFKHAHRNDFVILSCYCAIIAIKKVNRQILAPVAGMLQLVFGDVDGRDGTLVSRGEVMGKAAPAAAYVKQMVLGGQIQFFGDKVQFIDLGLIQAGCLFEITAAILTVGIKK
jgi:hypothetical protein